ncbi:MAG: c-type cytochrome [Pirellulaceae bacterium]|nr:c-type cytochrome [Pirellulaceae bacterium]
MSGRRTRRSAAGWFLWGFAAWLPVLGTAAVRAAETPGGDVSPAPATELAAGLTPEEAAARMTAPAGFHVQLAAGEPQVHQPVAMAIDHRGRVWIAEAYTYPQRAPEGKGLDKIIILEDTDGDGTLDRRTVFAEGLNLVSGLEVGFGGVWVGAAPYLLFLPDRDGDDRPDGPPEVLLDGFGYQDTHETLNTFIWGPDGWLYGCHGVFTHSRVGKPGTPDDERTPMNAAVWRYHPQRHVFEVFAHGTSNPWGVDFDEHGQAFITACVIPHLYHVIQGGRYQRQAGQHFNPYTYDDIKTIADHLHYVGRIQDHAWWGHESHAPASTLAAGGGHAHCGAMVYLGDNWPDEFRGGIFMNNIHGNRVNHDRPERRGSGFVGRHRPDVVLANDHWFRGINLRCGPDGGVYLIDWYDKNACHRTNPEIWDRSNGRVFRITYGEVKPVQVDLARLSSEELLDLQSHKNEWYVRTARRLLQERRDLPAASLARMAQDTAAGRLRRLWLEHVLGDGTHVDPQWLDDQHEYVRAWAIQLELEDGIVPDWFSAKLANMARDDQSPVVRLYIASALQRMPLADRWDAAFHLVQHGDDDSDHNLPLMIWYAVEPLVAADPACAMQLAEASRIPRIRQFLIRRAASAPETLEHAVAVLARAGDAATQQSILDEMLRAFEGRVGIPMPPSWTPAYQRLMVSSHAGVRDRADQVAVLLGDARIFPRMRELLTDAAAPVERRSQALAILVRGRDPDAATSLQTVLDEPRLRGAAIRALAAYDDPRTAGVLLQRYPNLTAEERGDAIGTLIARPDSVSALLDAMERGDVPRTDLHAYHVRQVLEFRRPAIEERLRDVWGEIRGSSADRQAKIDQWKQRLTPAVLAAADTGNGRRIYDKTCSACHVLFGTGGQVGPDITGSNRADLDYLLENLLDPSAVLGKDYRMSVFQLEDGRVISGLIQKETDSALTVRTLNDTVVLARQEIEEQQLSPLSLMPDGQLDPLTFDEVRDLIAYLGSPAQVAVKGPPAPIDPQTGGVSGAIEGESMNVIGKTAGNVRNQNMKGFGKDRWSNADHLWWTGAKPGDKLELEVPVEKDGRYGVEMVLTKAHDYGIVRLSLGEQSLGPDVDLYNSPDVITTGVLTSDPLELRAGNHRLTVEIVGAHPKAQPGYMFGLDYVRLVPQ